MDHTPTVRKSIDVSVPVHRAYEAWSDLTSFPRYMKHVQEVTQTGPTLYHWKVAVGPFTHEFDATGFFEPDRSISWESTEGAENGGSVGFIPLGEGSTRVELELEYQPPNALEGALNSLFHLVAHDAEDALQAFKEHVESGAA